MPKSPPEGFPTVCPYLYYQDVAAAIDWLAKAFGFEKRMAMPGPGGTVMHAEMDIGEGVVMLGPANAQQGSQSPRALGAVNQSLYVYVPDVAAHFARARAAGAAIVSEPVEMFWGDKFYVVRDLEGHHWSFAQHVRDVAPEDMKPPGA
ncbi:MAG TPA: VOC family protein [Myxococcota bacterium]|nr:VOC family protein [Myxococcota bacterium]